MPIIEYECSDCKDKFELIQKFSDAPLITCSKCNKDTLVKLVSLGGFRLKGIGWYKTS